MQHKLPAQSIKNRNIQKRRGSKLHIAVLSLKIDSSCLSSLVVFLSLLPITQSVRALFIHHVLPLNLWHFIVCSPPHSSPNSHPCFLQVGQEYGLQTMLTQKLLWGQSGVCSRLQQRKTKVDASCGLQRAQWRVSRPLLCGGNSSSHLHGQNKLSQKDENLQHGRC